MNGFSDADYVNFRYLVHSNVVQAVTQLLKAAEQFNYTPDDNEKLMVSSKFHRTSARADDVAQPPFSSKLWSFFAFTRNKLGRRRSNSAMSSRERYL